MFWPLLILTILMMTAWTVEKQIHDKQQKDFLAVIHVNGIRGKTSTCRLLDAALRSKYRVFTKTTGTDPVWIGTDGLEHPVRRLGPANIREQLNMLRKAHRQKAEIVILECMAVRPELQKICQEQIVRSKITVITNIRRDHMFELGETAAEIAQAFSTTVPRNGTVFTADEQTAQLMWSCCGEKGAKLHLCGTNGSIKGNRQIALRIAEELGIPQDQAERNIQANYREDFGAQWRYPLPGGREFLNLFSVNDPDSTRSILEGLKSERPFVLLFNHRYDRPDRLLLFCRHFFPFYPEAAIYCTGQGAYLLCRFLKGRRVTALRSWQECLDHIPKNSLLVGIGSIKGEGYRMIQALEKGKVGWMNEIVFGGIVAAVVFTELTSLSPGGLIVPAYLALYIYAPERIAATILLAFFCMGVVRLCSRWMILYGRRRYFVFLAVGMLAKLALGMSGSGAIGTIGYLIPGLLGRDMERQGILKTLASATIVTVFIVLGGMVLGVAWL